MVNIKLSMVNAIAIHTAWLQSIQVLSATVDVLHFDFDPSNLKTQLDKIPELSE